MIWIGIWNIPEKELWICKMQFYKWLYITYNSDVVYITTMVNDKPNRQNYHNPSHNENGEIFRLYNVIQLQYTITIIKKKQI